MPDVTVVIPTRDRGKLLATRSLRAALSQRWVSLEVVLVDDGSHSAVSDPADPRVRVIRHVAPRGVAAARNTGLDAALGRWVAFLDDDDVWAPHKLHTQLAALRHGGDFAYASAVAVDARLRPARMLTAPDEASLLTALLSRNVLPAGSSNIVARTELLRGLGGFDESFTRLDDWDCWLRLAGQGTPARCAETLVGHVVHAGSRLQQDPDGQEEELDRLEAKHGARFDRRDFRRYTAVAHRRAGRRRAATRLYLRNARQFRSTGDVVRAAVTLAGAQPRRSRPRPAVPWLVAYG
jgi:hypothetical protein